MFKTKKNIEQTIKTMDEVNIVSPRMKSFYIAIVYISIIYPRVIFVPFFGAFDFSLYTQGSALVFLFSIMVFFSNSKIRRAWSIAISRNKSLFILYILIIFWYFIADILGSRSGDSMTNTFHTFLYKYSYLFTASIFFIDSDCRRRAIKAIVISTVIVGLIGMIETIQKNTIIAMLNIPIYSSANLAASLSSATGGLRDGQFRAQSVFVHPIIFSQFMAAMIPISLYCFKNSKSQALKLLCLAVTPIAVIDIVASGSRSPLGVLIVCVIFYVIAPMLYKKSTLIMAIIATLFFGGLLNTYSADIQTLIKGKSATQVGSTQARVLMYQLGMKALSKSPITGFGEGMSLSKAGLTTSEGKRTIDSYYLSAAVDTGFVGITLLGLFFLHLIIAAFRAAKIDSSAFPIAAFVLGLIIGLSIISIDDTLTYIFMGAGYIIAISAKQKPKPKPGEQILAGKRLNAPPAFGRLGASTAIAAPPGPQNTASSHG